MYSDRQIHCMQAMGLVPWVRRDTLADARKQTIADQHRENLAVEVEPEVLTPATTARAVQSKSAEPVTPLQRASQAVTAITGDNVVSSGDANSSVLLIFDKQNGASQWPLSKADDALLDGMLRAIGMTKASVCSCAFVADESAEQQPLQALCQAPRKFFLFFGGDDIALNVTDPVPMSQPGTVGAIDGWRLPSLATLREQPQRKRQAWITLKLLRSSLDHN